MVLSGMFCSEREYLQLRHWASISPKSPLRDDVLERVLDSRIPSVAQILPIAALAPAHLPEAVDQFDAHHVFCHLVAELPLDPEPDRRPVRNRQSLVVHL